MNYRAAELRAINRKLPPYVIPTPSASEGEESLKFTKDKGSLGCTRDDTPKQSLEQIYLIIRINSRLCLITSTIKDP